MLIIPSQFESAFLKMARANEHLATLGREVQDFFKTHPYEIKARIEADGCEFVHSVRVLEPPPRQLAVIIGDCVHNLRSALDSLAWELSNKPTRPQDRRRISFPIYSRPADRRAVDAANIVHSGARVVVHSLQPYSALYYLPGALPLHPFQVLQYLSNRDKHREINLVGFAFQYFKVIPSEPAIFHSERLGPFEDGAEISRVRFAHSKVEVQFQFSFGVTMELTDFDLVAAVGPTLEDISHFINDVAFPNLCRPEFFEHQMSVTGDD